MPGPPSDAAREMIAAGFKPYKTSTERPERPAVPRNIDERPLQLSPMANIKGDRPPEFEEDEEW